MNKIQYLLCISICLFAASCSDVDDEIKDLDLDRLLSPVDVNVTIINRTNARINWKNNGKADSYVIELFADDTDLTFEGTPSVTVDNITNDDIPYTVMGLDGETTYALRIKAVSNSIPESKWTVAKFETSTEQILETVSGNDIEIHSVTLRWPAGYTATSIVVTNEEGVVVKTHTVTTSEIAAGTATVDGLEGNTTYTARLVNGDKTRGSVTFTTNYDGTAVTPTGDEATDTAALLEAIASTTDGVVAIMEGTLVINADLEISSSLALIAATAVKPTVVGLGFDLKNEFTTLRLSNLILDGAGSSTKSNLMNVSTAGLSYGDILIENCEIMNYGSRIIYNNVASTVNSLTITNSIVHDGMYTGGDLIDFRAAPLKNLSVSQSTFFNCSREFVRMDAASAFSDNMTIDINQCTFYNLQGTGSTARMLYVRYVNNTIRFRNNIIANTPNGYFSNSNSIPKVTFNNNYYYESPIYLAKGAHETAALFDTSGKVVNPGFVDPEKGDFTITSEDLLYEGAGDPRWY